MVSRNNGPSGYWAVGIIISRGDDVATSLYASNSLSTELYNYLYVCSNPTQPVSVGLLLATVLWYALISYRAQN